MRRPGGLELVALALGGALVTVATRAALYAHNTLAAHPDWATSKALLAAPVMGSAEQLVTRNALQFDRLNLDPWYGNNEMLLDRILPLGSLGFRFRLDPDAFLYAIVGRTSGGFSALRLSRSGRHPSAWVRATPGGRFLEKRLVALAPGPGWHEADVVVDASGALSIVDGVRLPERHPIRFGARQVVGFRGGSRPAAVDDVVIRDPGGRLLLSEDFANRRGRLGFALTVASLLIATAALLVWLARRRHLDPSRTGLAFLTLEIVLLSLTSSWLAFDLFVWSGRYPYERHNWQAMRLAEAQLGAETLRRAVADRLPFVGHPEPSPTRSSELVEFLRLSPHQLSGMTGPTAIRRSGSGQQIDTLSDAASAITAYLRGFDPATETRILLIGTSQAWGSGAWRPEERMAARLQHYLDLARPSTDAVVLNASVRGSRSGELLRRFRSHLGLFRPRLVVVHLSNNDETEGFGANLSAIVAHARSLGAATLFVLEAVRDGPVGGVGTRHAIMRQLAAREGVAIADLQAHLDDPDRRDSGILWWDQVHLTSWGQELAARFLAEAVLHQRSTFPPSG